MIRGRPAAVTEADITKSTIELDTILKGVTPIEHQHAHEIQPFGHLVHMPIALSATTCQESVENLNQLLADTIALRDLYKRHPPAHPCARAARRSS